MPERRGGIPVVTLVRVSTAEQADDDRAGIARQEAAIASAVARHGLKPVRRLQLVDVSGTSVAATPEMAELLELVRTGRAQGVCVADFDRLLRPDDFRSFAVLQDILEAGAIIFLPDQALDLSTQAGWLTSSLQSVIAGNERTQIMKRMNGAKEAMRRAGKHPGGAITLPLGVSYDRKREQFYYNDDAEIIRELFRLFHEEGVHNYSELARRTGLGRTSIPSKLTNRLYIGVRRYDTKRGKDSYRSKDGRRADKKLVPRAEDEIVEVTVIDKPLIDPEVFWTVQDMVLGNKRRVVHLRKDGDLAYLFKGMLRCGYDDEPIYTTGQCASRRGCKIYYTCKRNTSQYKDGPQCQSRAYHGVRLEAALIRFVADCLASEEYVAAQVEGMVDEEAVERRRRALEKVRSEIKGLAGQEGRLVDLFVDGAVGREIYDRKLEELHRGRVALEAQEQVLMREEEQLVAEDWTEAVREIASALAEFEFWARAEQRELLEQLRAEFWITEEGITKVRLPLGGRGLVMSGQNEPRLSAARFRGGS